MIEVETDGEQAGSAAGCAWGRRNTDEPKSKSGAAAGDGATAPP
jgi:hypothetical protein